MLTVTCIALHGDILVGAAVPTATCIELHGDILVGAAVPTATCIALHGVRQWWVLLCLLLHV